MQKGKHFPLFRHICPITSDNFIYAMLEQIHQRIRNVHNGNRNNKRIKAAIQINEYQKCLDEKPK